MSYKCDYCGDALCPEVCPEAKTAYQKYIKDKEDKQEVVTLDNETFRKELLEAQGCITDPSGVFSLFCKKWGLPYYD